MSALAVANSTNAAPSVSPLSASNVAWACTKVSRVPRDRSAKPGSPSLSSVSAAAISSSVNSVPSACNWAPATSTSTQVWSVLRIASPLVTSPPPRTSTRSVSASGLNSWSLTRALASSLLEHPAASDDAARVATAGSRIVSRRRCTTVRLAVTPRAGSARRGSAPGRPTARCPSATAPPTGRHGCRSLPCTSTAWRSVAIASPHSA